MPVLDQTSIVHHPSHPELPQTHVSGRSSLWGGCATAGGMVSRGEWDKARNRRRRISNRSARVSEIRQTNKVLPVSKKGSRTLPRFS